MMAKTKSAASEKSKVTASGSEDGVQSLADKLAALQTASPGELRAAWRQNYGNDPPSVSRDLLARALVYQLQEKAFGGLSRASLRRLEEIANRVDGAAPVREPRPVLRSGARLVREWRGRAHVVTVTDAGFEYAGASYGSLTQIAKEITGAHWSGPRFFGLRNRKSGPEQANG
jgi:Protein of unknown function (DUF2924)